MDVRTIATGARNVSAEFSHLADTVSHRPAADVGAFHAFIAPFQRESREAAMVRGLSEQPVVSAPFRHEKTIVIDNGRLDARLGNYGIDHGFPRRDPGDNWMGSAEQIATSRRLDQLMRDMTVKLR
ncbi:MAG: hypothetical protein JWM98_2035 [Thermoleophilia bacterium]|nr:hypothetical protein [Thermoleophilia bacterium]